ncbi:DnaJ domain [Trypanosoma vivax]|uniref:Putative chaperone protein DNAj n=1 Tax=Trypanosoma vivax (strain Y486) TaxID=1055687 RepID=G0U416_TRYVY|nr:putative chaperone protein DNAj [Trypanosoma vivax]KAH8612064.1 DnaJ domain [Trypanosoma vivax]CCC52178.1 putative chaperone protein DNAj [Trypanosoma vivax Y486]
MKETHSPYEILGLNPSASTAEIRKAFKRLALSTHPDKQSSPATGNEPVPNTRVKYPFYLVKEAADQLLDPLRRAEYDSGGHLLSARSAGVVSDSYNLSEFELVDKKLLPVGVVVLVYRMECRCGGVFEVFLTRSEGAEANYHQLCECDSCSLVVEVNDHADLL